MRAVVRHFISPDVDLDRFEPDEIDNFSFLLQALIGPADSIGEESLQFIVCTPRALEDMVKADGVVFGRPLVVVATPNIAEILDAVRAAIERPEAPSWDILTGRLGRIGIYEFEDALDE